MKSFLSKRLILAVVVLVVLAGSFFLFFTWYKSASKPIITPPVKVDNLNPNYSVIGTSVEGRKIEAFTYGNGEKHILFVGGIHGGYEWNSVLLAYQFIDYLKADPGIIPSNITVTVIPSANPDGIYKVIGKAGRFYITDVNTNVSEALGRVNAHDVDLNRNFDCLWQATSTWQNKPESGGSTVFSEPETRAIRDYISKDKPVAAVFWHSKSNAVYASQCGKGILPGTLDIMDIYSKASGYPAVKVFTAYVTTGAAEDWLASINIPAITVELATHETVEWNKNLAGIKAIFEYYRGK